MREGVTEPRAAGLDVRWGDDVHMGLIRLTAYPPRGDVTDEERREHVRLAREGRERVRTYYRAVAHDRMHPPEPRLSPLARPTLVAALDLLGLEVNPDVGLEHLHREVERRTKVLLWGEDWAAKEKAAEERWGKLDRGPPHGS